MASESVGGKEKQSEQQMFLEVEFALYSRFNQIIKLNESRKEEMEKGSKFLSFLYASNFITCAQEVLDLLMDLF